MLSTLPGGICGRRALDVKPMSSAIHTEQREKTDLLLKSKGMNAALFANPETITWLTGFAPFIEMGQSPYSGGPALIWYQGGEFTLIVMDGEAADLFPMGIPVLKYKGYTYEAPFAGVENLKFVLKGLVGRRGRQPGKTGCEKAHLPACLYELLLESGLPLSMDGWLNPMRVVKTAEELEKLSASFALVDAGQTAAREAVRVGLREIDLWELVHGTVNRLAGERVALGNDCVVSYREDNSGGFPRDLPLRPGDSLLLDLGARYRGYWSDSCATYYPTGLSQDQARMYQVVQDALDLAISLVKPGRPANEIDWKVRELIGKSGYPVYPHHTGHGVGASSHEEPRITPYNQNRLETGMVILLEPGIYLPQKAAVRLEDGVIVTETGATLLTHHLKR